MQKVLIVDTVDHLVDVERLVRVLRTLARDVRVVPMDEQPDVDLRAIIRKLELSMIEPLPEPCGVDRAPEAWDYALDWVGTRTPGHTEPPSAGGLIIQRRYRTRDGPTRALLQGKTHQKPPR